MPDLRAICQAQIGLLPKLPQASDQQPQVQVSAQSHGLSAQFTASDGINGWPPLERFPDGAMWLVGRSSGSRPCH